MHHLPLLGESGEAPPTTDGPGTQRRVVGVTADGTMWIYCMVQYADALLSQPKYIQSTLPFSPEQRQAWDRYRASTIATKTPNSAIHRFIAEFVFQCVWGG